MKSLNAQQVKQLAKELKIKNWWNKKRDDLVSEIAELKGWGHEPKNIQEYLVAGGQVQQCPDMPSPMPACPTETSASLKAPKKPSKKASPKKAKKAKKSEANVVSLSDICQELKIEPRVARRKLRNSDIKKPAAGWEWKPGDTDIDAVKELLK